MNRSEYINRVQSEFTAQSSNDWNSLFLSHEFSGGVIDYERVEARVFFEGKKWDQIDFQVLEEKPFYTGCLSKQGFIEYFPVILLASLVEKQSMSEQNLFYRVKSLDETLIETCRLMTPQNRELFFDIIDMWGNEDHGQYENNSLVKILSFKAAVENN